MEDNYCVYKHTNIVNGKVYIGMTMLKPEYRYGRNGSGYKECPYFWNAIQKYGWDSFTHEVLADGLTGDEAANMEIEMIEKYHARDGRYGYNLHRGGYSQSGEANPFYGHHHTQEVKDAVIASNKRRVWTEEAKNSMREKLSGENSPSAKKVICVETGEVFPTLGAAAASIGVKPTKICDALKGRAKTCHKLHWKYYDP